jgi:uncharacterized membrane protein YphA (DoxX/SURF4 family)
MKRVISTPAVGFHYRLVLAGVLLYAGGAKFFEGGYAAQMAINAYKIFPPAWAPFLGHFLPGLEILLGILLLAGMFVRLTSLLTAILMTGFILGIISVWVRGYSIDCGCFGGGGEVSAAGKTWRYSSEILRDLLFVGLAVRLVVWPSTPFAFDNLGTRHTYSQESPEEQ